MKRLILTPIFIVLCLLGLKAQITVTASLGTPGPTVYTTLKAAFDAINAGIHQGAILMTVTANTNEITTAILNGSGTGSSNYMNILIKPSGGAARTISGNIPAGNPLIDLNGADFVTIDGLNTGGNSLTISNTMASATAGTSTIRLQADATQNHIENCSILGSGTMANGIDGGNIWIGGASTVTGNDNNLIENCTIGPAGSNLPSKCVYFSGTTNNDPGTANSSCTIADCRIFDFFSPTVNSSGIDITSGTTSLDINDNLFYQTAARTQTATGITHRPININNANGNHFRVSNNIIGYASSTGTGTYTLVFPVTTNNSFIPVYLNVGSTTLSEVKGNTIVAMAISGGASGTGTSSPFRCIYINNGLVTVGVGTANTIGSQSTTGSITYTSNSASNSDIVSIYNNGADDWNVANNLIGGITTSNTSTGAVNIYGIRANTGISATFTCTNNTIGGTVANSIQSTSSSTSSLVDGILVQNTIGYVTGNTLRNLTASGGTGFGTGSSVTGIVINAASLNSTVTQNSIHHLNNLHATDATHITGIQFNGSTGANLVNMNRIYALSVASNNAACQVSGIRIAGGTTDYENNMIAIGAEISTACVVSGIFDPSGTGNYYHNSIYIGGAPTSGNGNSYAFNSTVVTNARDIRNNIFFNARSNAGATGKNYVIRVGGTAPDPAGLTLDYNLYYQNGTGGMLGSFNNIDVANLMTWRTIVGQDAKSIVANPKFIDPANVIPDLHLHPTDSTAAEKTGINAGVGLDFDGQTRALLSPTDMGADAGHFTAIPMTYYSSAVTQTNTTPVPNAINQEIIGIRIIIKGYSNPLSATSFSLSTSGTSSLTDIANAKLFYTGASSAFATSVQFGSTIAVPGVSFAITGSQTLMPDSNFFWLTYDILPTAISGNAVDANCISVTIGTSHGPSPPSVTGSRTISPIKVTATSGNAGPLIYPSLKNAFDQINAGLHQGDITIQLTGNSTEPSTASLNGSGTGSSSYTSLSIQPLAGVAITIKGNFNASPVIDLNGADHVTIDGLNTGGNALIITNTAASSSEGTSTIRMIGDATYNVIRRCSIRGSAIMAAGVRGGTILIEGNAVSTGNDNNIISKCSIGPEGSNLPTKGIYLKGSGDAEPGIANSGIVIDSNDIFNYYHNSSNSSGIDLQSGNSFVTISHNKFYQTTQRTLTGSAVHKAISINCPNGHHFQVTDNTIGFNSNAGTGTYSLNFQANSFEAISLAVSGTDTSSVQGNKISNIYIGSNPSGSGSLALFKGIFISQGLVRVGNVSGNVIGSPSTTGNITCSATTSYTIDMIGLSSTSTSDLVMNNNIVSGLTLMNNYSGICNVFGFQVNGTPTGKWTCVNNTIGGTVSNSIQCNSLSSSSTVTGIYKTNCPALIRGNTIRNLTTDNGSNYSMLGISSSNSTASDTITQNTISGLTNTNPSSATVVMGIFFTSGTASNLIDRNKIYNLKTMSNNASAEISGIKYISSPTTIRNNMIALGTGVSNAILIYGLNEVSGIHQVLHNSVYIGGSPISGASTSSAFISTASGSGRIIKNNIFVNARSNNGATGKNYTVRIPLVPGLSSNYNIFHANGNGTLFCQYGTIDISSLYVWNLISGQDGSSIEANPVFADPANAIPDLHIHPTNATPAESTGLNMSVVDDFDGQTRSSLTPVDIGADAGNFTPPQPMSYVSSTTTQSNTSMVAVTAVNQQVIGIEIVTTGISSPLAVTSFTLKTNGTTALTDIANARLYGTGSSPVFDISNQFGIPVGAPGSTFSITGSRPLINGTNYFWLTYDITINSNGGDIIDAECSSINVGTVQIPTVQVPAGSRPVSSIAVNAAGIAAPYLTLKNAFDAINAGAHHGAMFIFVSGNTTETATAQLNSSGSGSSSYTNVVMYPTGATSRTISGAVPAGNALIYLNGADNVIIDGTGPGGSTLTISNTTVSSMPGTSTIRFYGDATQNQILDCTILGSATMGDGVYGGNILIDSGAVFTGNDNILINYCNIGPAGSNLPSKCIFLGGNSNVDPGTANSGITITGNNIYDFFSATTSSSGIELKSGTVGTIISNNRFYQSNTRTQTSTAIFHRPINIDNANGNGFQITGNTIGFADYAGNGIYAFVYPSSSSNNFFPIYINAGALTTTSIQNNTITRIAMSGGASGSGTNVPFACIYIDEGLVNVGDDIGNNIGSQTETGNITFSTTASGATTIGGIYYLGVFNSTFKNNFFGGIKGSSASGAANINVILNNGFPSTTCIIEDNIIGGTVANSIESTSTSTANFMNGIRYINSNVIIKGNTIRNMTSAGGEGLDVNASIVGISIAAANGTYTVSQNTICNLHQTNPTAASVVTAIFYSASGGSHIIDRNFIFGLLNDSNSSSGEVNGIRTNNANCTIQNNMIALGAGVNTAMRMKGIGVNTGSHHIYHNTVFISGSPTSGTDNSFAFSGSTPIPVQEFRNNIFINTRSNNGASGKHYAIFDINAMVDPPGMIMESNLYSVGGIGSYLGRFGGTDVSTLAMWQDLTGQDSFSYQVLPSLIDPNNAIPNLHLDAAFSSLAEGRGEDVGVTEDFDGDVRASNSPTDIGADAGNFTYCHQMVMNANNSGQGSLRSEIGCAQPGTIIAFDNSLTNQTLVLTSGEIDINKNLTLSGPGVNALTLSGNNTSRIFHILNGNLFSIKNLSLKNADSPLNGGAIYVQGDLLLENVRLENNKEMGVPRAMTIAPNMGVDVTIVGIVEVKQ